MGRGAQRRLERAVLRVDARGLCLVCPRPVFVEPLFAAAGDLCFGPDGQANAGDVAGGPAVVGLLAAGTLRRCSGPPRRASRCHTPAPRPCHDGRVPLATAHGENPAAPAGGRFLPGYRLGPRQGRGVWQSADDWVAHRQRLGFVCRLSRAGFLARGTGGVLSASGIPSADLGGTRRPGSVGGYFGGGAEVAAALSVFSRGLAVVRGDARARDRNCPGRVAGDGRPLYLFAADWALPGPGLGRGRRVPVSAVSSLAVRRRIGAGACGLDGVRMASDVLLVRQRDVMEPYPGLYDGQQRGGEQPGSYLGQPRPP